MTMRNEAAHWEYKLPLFGGIMVVREFAPSLLWMDAYIDSDSLYGIMQSTGELLAPNEPPVPSPGVGWNLGGKEKMFLRIRHREPYSNWEQAVTVSVTGASNYEVTTDYATDPVTGFYTFVRVMVEIEPGASVLVKGQLGTNSVSETIRRRRVQPRWGAQPNTDLADYRVTSTEHYLTQNWRTFQPNSEPVTSSLIQARKKFTHTRPQGAPISYSPRQYDVMIDSVVPGAPATLQAQVRVPDRELSGWMPATSLTASIPFHTDSAMDENESEYEAIIVPAARLEYRLEGALFPQIAPEVHIKAPSGKEIPYDSYPLGNAFVYDCAPWAKYTHASEAESKEAFPLWADEFYNYKLWANTGAVPQPTGLHNFLSGPGTTWIKGNQITGEVHHSTVAGTWTKILDAGSDICENISTVGTRFRSRNTMGNNSENLYPTDNLASGYMEFECKGNYAAPVPYIYSAYPGFRTRAQDPVPITEDLRLFQWQGFIAMKGRVRGQVQTGTATFLLHPPLPDDLGRMYPIAPGSNDDTPLSDVSEVTLRTGANAFGNWREIAPQLDVTRPLATLWPVHLKAEPMPWTVPKSDDPDPPDPEEGIASVIIADTTAGNITGVDGVPTPVFGGYYALGPERTMQVTDEPNGNQRLRVTLARKQGNRATNASLQWTRQFIPPLVGAGNSTYVADYVDTFREPGWEDYVPPGAQMAEVINFGKFPPNQKIIFTNNANETLTINCEGPAVPGGAYAIVMAGSTSSGNIVGMDGESIDIGLGMPQFYGTGANRYIYVVEEPNDYPVLQVLLAKAGVDRETNANLTWTRTSEPPIALSGNILGAAIVDSIRQPEWAPYVPEGAQLAATSGFSQLNIGQKIIFTSSGGDVITLECVSPP